MKITLGFRKNLIIIALSGTAILGMVLITLFNMSSTLSLDQAEKRIRVYLTKQMSEKLVQVNNEFPSGFEKEKKLSELAEELKQINAIKITSIEVRKLIPDIVIRPHRPTHIVRVEMHTDTKTFPPRYFWLPWTSIDSETTETAWYLSL